MSIHEAPTDEVEGEEPGDTYRVGYGRPPKASQYKKGVSGNPAGAPKRAALSLQSILEDALAEPLLVRANGKQRKMTSYEAILWAHFRSALQGNLSAIRRILRLAKRCDRWSDRTVVSSVLYVDRPDNEYLNALSEYRDLKAAGIDPWSRLQNVKSAQELCLHV